MPLSFLTIPASKFYLILIKNGKFFTVIGKLGKIREFQNSFSVATLI